MSSLQQHLADTAANLNAQWCELNELRERVRKALLSAPKSPQPKQWNERRAEKVPPARIIRERHAVHAR
jgi:hypothetical protein